MKTLEAKSEQVRELHLRIDDLQRERDDLIAMWKGKEKEKIGHLTDVSSDGSQSNSSDSSDWAILCACKCGDAPCGCAKVLAQLRRKMLKFMEEAEEASRERFEALEVAEAYRLALEQQMERGRNLAHQLVVMATKTDLVQTPKTRDESKRNQRAKHTFKWVVNQLNTDDMKILVNAKKEEEEEEKRSAEERRRKEEEERREMVKAIRTEAALFLAEMLNDLNEALTQQRVVSHLLNIRNKHLEEDLEEKSNSHTPNENAIVRETREEERRISSESSPPSRQPKSPGKNDAEKDSSFGSTNDDAANGGSVNDRRQVRREDRRNLFHSSGLPGETESSSSAAAMDADFDRNGDFFDDPPEWLIAETLRRRQRGEEEESGSAIETVGLSEDDYAEDRLIELADQFIVNGRKPC